jgi:glycosyltransferase involved in cell wall biosynthesis
MSGLSLRILGIRGVPAAHGGFETFAERLAPYLVERGWRVTVYCQEDGDGPVLRDTWQGVHRVRIPVRLGGAPGTVLFDWLSIQDAARAGEPCLTLGYNTALLCARLRVAGVVNVINMDGIEWQRAKYGPLARAWLRLNERAGAWFGQHLVADHPEIARHLSALASADRITTIPYGADPVTQASSEPVRALGLEPGRYLTLIARPEPENGILEVVRAFSARSRGVELAVLGRYEPGHAYHEAVRAAAGAQVRFLGAIYDTQVVQALRQHAFAHIHGHRVGGTNPSLVEALGAGNAVLADDNRFNRWVAGAGALYYADEAAFDTLLQRLQDDPATLEALRQAARSRFSDAFDWPRILQAYENLLGRFAGSGKVIGS